MLFLQEGQLPQTESAHLTWLYRMVAVQKAFQSETIASATKTCKQRRHLSNQKNTSTSNAAKLAQLSMVFDLSLTHSFGVNA